MSELLAKAVRNDAGNEGYKFGGSSRLSVSSHQTAYGIRLYLPSCHGSGFTEHSQPDSSLDVLRAQHHQIWYPES